MSVMQTFHRVFSFVALKKSKIILASYKRLRSDIKKMCLFRSRYIKNDKDVLFSKDLNCLVRLLKANILHCQQQQNYVINYPWVLNYWLDKKQLTDVTFPLAACDRHVFHFITKLID